MSTATAQHITDDLDSKTLRYLLANAPAGLIFIAGLFLIAGAAFRLYYYTQTLSTAFGLAAIVAALCIALGLAALRLLLMINSGRDFKADNPLAGWVGVAFSIGALAYDLQEGWHIAQFITRSNPADFQGLFGLMLIVHVGAFFLEVRLIMTMYSDVLERRRSEDRTLEQLSEQYTRNLHEADRKTLAAIADRNKAIQEAEAFRQRAEAAESRITEAERKFTLAAAESERQAKISGADQYGELQKVKADLEATNRKLRDTQAELARKTQAELTEVTRRKQVEQEAEALSEQVRKLQSELTEARRKPRPESIPTPRAGVSVSDSGDTRSRILECARRLYRTSGRIPTKVEVENECGISTRTMQKYFADGAWQAAIIDAQAQLS